MTDDHHAIADDLYEQVGKALSAWSQVEEMLCSIYAMTVIDDLKDPIGSAASAFWAIVSFEAKLKMTNAALRYRIFRNEALLEEWHALFGNLSRKANKRAELAHGTVVSWNYEDPKKRAMTTDTFFVPSLYKQLYARAQSYITGSTYVSASSDTRPEKRLYRQDIKQRRKGFQKAEDRLKKFQGKLYRELELIAEGRERALAQVLGHRNEESQTQSETLSPPQPSEG